MKKILILLQSPFLKKDYDRFGIDTLKKNFFVEIFDFSPWLRPKTYNDLKDKIFYCKEYKKITSKNNFINTYSNLDSFWIFDFLDKRSKTMWIRNQLKKKENVFIHFNINLIPTNIKISKKILKFLYMIKKPKIFFKFIFNVLIFAFNKYKYSFKPDIVVTGGLVASHNKNIKKKIAAHCLDYDTYLRIKDKPVIKQEKYAVYIDQALTTHPDYKIRNIQAPASRTNYYPVLNNFFYNFKGETGLSIKFAMHPMSQEEKISLLLKGIDICKENTPELIKNSSVVLTHNSTATSFAILFNKPIINLTSEELRKSWLGPEIEAFSKSNGGKMINMDKSIKSQINLDQLLKIDELKYKKFKDDYIKMPNSPNVPLWEIVSNNLIS